MTKGQINEQARAMLEFVLRGGNGRQWLSSKGFSIKEKIAIVRAANRRVKKDGGESDGIR